MDVICIKIMQRNTIITESMCDKRSCVLVEYDMQQRTALDTALQYSARHYFRFCRTGLVV